MVSSKNKQCSRCGTALQDITRREFHNIVSVQCGSYHIAGLRCGSTGTMATVPTTSTGWDALSANTSHFPFISSKNYLFTGISNIKPVSRHFMTNLSLLLIFKLPRLILTLTRFALRCRVSFAHLLSNLSSPFYYTLAGGDLTQFFKSSGLLHPTDPAVLLDACPTWPFTLTYFLGQG